MKVLELLALEGRKLHELNDMLPNWFFRHRALRCPWERKGEVMRTIADDYAGAEIEMFDGVRIRTNGGWFLVLPDASDPTVNVYAEGKSSGAADDLLAGVVTRIEALVEL